MSHSKALREVESHVNRSKLYYCFIITIVLLIVVQVVQPLIESIGEDPYEDLSTMPARGRVNIKEPFGVCHGGGDQDEMVNQGVQITRNDIYWESFEPTKGNFNFAH